MAYLLALTMLLSPQDNCGVVHDGAGILRNLTAVTAMATRIHEADVHVYTLHNYAGYSNLDQYQIAHERACGWLGTDGARRPNLLAVAISLSEKKMGIYYGTAFSDRLTSQYLRIQQGFMRPQMRAGNPDGAFVEALGEIARLLTTVAVTPQATPQVASPPATLPASFWIWLCGILGVGGLVGLGIVLHTRRRARLDALDETKQTLRSLVAMTSTQITRLRSAIATREREAPVYPSRLTQAREHFTAAAMDFDAQQSLPRSPSDEALPLWTYKEMLNAYHSIYANLQRSETCLQSAFQIDSPAPSPVVPSRLTRTRAGGDVYVIGNSFGEGESSRSSASHDAGGSSSYSGDSGGGSSSYGGGDSGGSSSSGDSGGGDSGGGSSGW